MHARTFSDLLTQNARQTEKAGVVSSVSTVTAERTADADITSRQTDPTVRKRLDQENGISFITSHTFTSIY